MEPVNVSVIVTVLNEQKSIRGLLDSLAEQTRRPDQLVICDGGSSDGTVAAIHDAIWRHGRRLGEVELFVLPGANISRGRNAAIKRARGPLIAATDAGVHLDQRWLESITSPWVCPEQRIAGSGPLAAGGFFVPDAETVFEIAMAATILPALDDVDPQRFLPSSRSVAFLKSAWESAGGYPEWLDYCEDLIFDFRMNALAPSTANAFVWCPGATVHFRPRSSLRSFWRQYYRYARGDGKADLWRMRHAVRYVTYVVVLPLITLLLLRGGLARMAGLAAFAAGIVVYCRRPWQRLDALSGGLSRRQRIQSAAYVPLIRAVGDLAKMAGYPVGLAWRWRNRQRREVHWRSTLPNRDA